MFVTSHTFRYQHCPFARSCLRGLDTVADSSTVLKRIWHIMCSSISAKGGALCGYPQTSAVSLKTSGPDQDFPHLCTNAL